MRVKGSEFSLLMGQESGEVRQLRSMVHPVPLAWSDVLGGPWYLQPIWGFYRDNGKKMETTMVYYRRVIWDYMGLSEVHGTYNLLSSCSHNPIISRVTVVMGLIFGL